MIAPHRGTTALLVLLAASAVARADKRPVPDYAGRESDTDASDALWLPRVLVSPLYLVSELVIRRPIGWLVTYAELDLGLTGGSGGESGDHAGKKKGVTILPTAYFELHFLPAVGVYFSWDELRARATTWGPSSWSVAAVERLPLVGPLALLLDADASHRRDYLYDGLGPRAPAGDFTRYAATRYDAGAGLQLSLAPFRVRAEVGARDVRFGKGTDDTCCDDPSLASEVAAGTVVAPPGFTNGYGAFYQRGQIDVERRNDRFGGRATLDGEHGDSWLRYGATAAGWWDVTGHGRLLSLSLTVDLTHGDAVPFTEQSQLGGAGPLVGFAPGRLVGASAAAATLRYDWPVWAWLQWSLLFEAGNVFGADLAGFDLKALRLSGGLSLSLLGGPEKDNRLELLTAVGTDPLDDGAAISSFRLVVGVVHGF